MKVFTSVLNKDNFKNDFLDKIQCGDSARILRQIPNESIDLTITSPPYFQQREYGGCEVGNERFIENYIDAIMDVFHECVRITKKCGSIVFNIGDKYQNGSLSLIPYLFTIQALKMEKVKLVNEITWIKSNPTPRQFKRRLVSSKEPFFHFVKTDSYYYNLDAFQSQKTQKKQPTKKTTVGNSYKALIKNSNLTVFQKKMAMKKLNLVIEETKKGIIPGFRMKISGIHAPAYGGQSGGRQIQMEKNGFTIIKMRGNAMKKDTITTNVENLKWNKHPAVYPESIISDLINLLTPPHAIVLDPYIGSGTTGVSAKKLNRHFIGIDINPEYCVFATERIKNI